MKITKLVFFALLLFVAKSTLAQTFTPVEYRFSEKPSHNDSGYVLRSSTNKIIKFISSASNGYGTWAVDDQSNWYLLSDTLVNERVGSSITFAHPSGVVEQDTLGSGFQSGAVKVTTNLKGEVWFVGGSPTGKFTVKGFRDFRDTNLGPMYKHLDIKFQGIPKPSGTRRILKNPLMINYNVRTGIPANPGVNLPIAPENDWRDGFDVCCDQKFMYIAWEYYNEQVPSGQPARYELYLTVIRLSDGSIYDSTKYTKLISPNGRRPTISCDPRNNPEAPDCDIAFIDFIPPYPTLPVTITNGKICYVRVQGITAPVKVFNNQFRKTPTITNGYFYATHTRMLTGSTYHARNYPCKVIYALINNYGGNTTEDSKNEFIIMYRFTSASNETTLPIGETVDGSFINYSSRTAPVSPPDDTCLHAILNTHLIGFANPYDGDTASGKYDEFHCIYAPKQYMPANNTNPHFETIIRGINNGVFNDVFGNTSTDTRTIINREKNSSGQFQFLPRPEHSYDRVGVIGGVNQMGIHLYWKDHDGAATYYSRDLRRFDEPIEENTLLTHYCEIGDGRSHKGTIGAQLLPNREMTLWTDPNFDVYNVSGVQSSGIYTARVTPKFTLGYHNAKLAYVDSGTVFIVGDSNTRSILTMLPNFEVRFDPNPNGTNSYKLAISGNSLWQYYGIPYSSSLGVHDAYNFYGKGEILLKGQSATLSETTSGYPVSLTKPATLVIHGGADMRLVDIQPFRAYNSYIAMENERSIEPVYTNSTGPDTNQWRTGSLTTNGDVVLSSCIITGEGTSTTNYANIINVRPNINTAMNPSRVAFYATSCLFRNIYNNGYSRILFQGVNGGTITSSFFNGKSYFMSGRLTRSQIYAEDPLIAFVVAGVEFDSTKIAGIHLKRKTSLDYHDITLLENSFLTYSLDSSRGILVENFDKHHEDTVNDNIRISVQENRFTSPTTETVGHKAIHLVNSSAGIVQNTISSSGYKFGIVVEGDSSISPLTSTAFMCSDSISNVNMAAIKTNNWRGYIKLCTLFNSNLGYLSGNDDRGGLVFSYVHRCEGPGITVFAPSGGSSLLDISGVHSTAPAEENDYAGYDTIKFNNKASGYPKGQIELVGDATLKMGSTSGYTNYGYNILTRNGTTDNFIYKSGTPTVSIGNADSNYWRDGDGTKYIPASSGTNPFENITYTSALPTENAVGVLSDVFCSSGYGFSQKGSKQKPMSIIQSEECQDLLDRGRALENGGGYQYAYDTLRHYIEQCANEYQSWFAFPDISGANGHRNDNNSRFTEYREWLKNVLYLNAKDSDYYCFDVMAIIGTFYWYDSVRGRDYNGSIAVEKYLLESNRCPKSEYTLLTAIEADRRHQLERYQDTVKDSLITPIDTTLPSLEDLGLGILRGQNGVVNPINENRIGELIAIRNPFTDLLDLKYRLETSSMVRVDIYDLLGKSVYSSGQGYKPNGEHILTIATDKWASGSYYVRLSTPSGEIKTVKLVKQ